VLGTVCSAANLVTAGAENTLTDGNMSN
jgi:hypothetical protein